MVVNYTQAEFKAKAGSNYSEIDATCKEAAEKHFEKHEDKFTFEKTLSLKDSDGNAQKVEFTATRTGTLISAIPHHCQFTYSINDIEVTYPDPVVKKKPLESLEEDEPKVKAKKKV